MIMFNGICSCSFIFNVEGRRPNFCPECGHKIEPKTVNKYEIIVSIQEINSIIEKEN